jgi:hypothetical protein
MPPLKMNTSFLFALSAAITATTFAQGPLNPPFAPAPSMKSLDQIEARTPIPASPAVPIAGPHFTITQPGSYYLTGNIEVASGNGIEITASDVSLDLNGFALISKTVVNPVDGNAISLIGNINNIHIKNGHIIGGTERNFTGPRLWQASFFRKGWRVGITDGLGAISNGISLSDLGIRACAQQGVLFFSGTTSMIQKVTATGNGGSEIFVSKSVISESGAFANGENGIDASASSLRQVTVNSNREDGIDGSDNTMSNITAESNGESGIFSNRSSVTNSTASYNNQNGINAVSGVVAYCVAAANNLGGVGYAEIYVSGGQRVACMPVNN